MRGPVKPKIHIDLGGAREPQSGQTGVAKKPPQLPRQHDTFESKGPSRRGLEPPPGERPQRDLLSFGKTIEEQQATLKKEAKRAETQAEISDLMDSAVKSNAEFMNEVVKDGYSASKWSTPNAYLTTILKRVTEGHLSAEQLRETAFKVSSQEAQLSPKTKPNPTYAALMKILEKHMFPVER